MAAHSYYMNSHEPFLWARKHKALREGEKKNKVQKRETNN